MSESAAKSNTTMRSQPPSPNYNAESANAEAPNQQEQSFGGPDMELDFVGSLSSATNLASSVKEEVTNKLNGQHDNDKQKEGMEISDDEESDYNT